MQSSRPPCEMNRASRVEALRPAHVEEALAAWIGAGRSDRRKDRTQPSWRTVDHAFATLRAIRAWGVRMQLMPRNVDRRT